MREIYNLTIDLVHRNGELADLLASVVLPPVRLTNTQLLVADADEVWPLYRPELEVLMDVILTYLDKNRDVFCAPNYGTLAIYGQSASDAYSASEKPLTLCYLLADLKDGPCKIPTYDAQPEMTSRKLVGSTAKKALQYRAGMEKPAFLCGAVMDGSVLKSGIYFDEKHYGLRGADNRAVLVLNGNTGRISMSFCCSGPMGDLEMLALMAQTVACLKSEDAKMQESIQIIRQQMKAENPRYGEVMKVVEQAFADGTDPIFRLWQDWKRETRS